MPARLRPIGLLFTSMILLSGCPAADPLGLPEAEPEPVTGVVEEPPPPDPHPWDGTWKLVTTWPELGITTEDCLLIEESRVVLWNQGCDESFVIYDGAVAESGALLILDLWKDADDDGFKAHSFSGMAQEDGTVVRETTCTVSIIGLLFEVRTGTGIMSRM